MKVQTITLMLLAVLACSKADTPVEAPTIAQEPAYEDYADDWIAFADATADLALDERKQAFRRDVEAKFPAFYTSRLVGDGDARLTRAIEDWEDMREAFITKHAGFSSSLDEGIAAFKQTFPDFEQNVKIGVVHSLGEMDGGTRTLDGEDWLLFGIDVMVHVHEHSQDARPFFTHELFHVHHNPRLGMCEVMWCALWAEGLAVYVSKQLFPNAGDTELLLNLPADMVERVRANTPAVAANMLEHFASEDGERYSALFQFSDDGSGLPPRRGYYLGYLVAAEIGADKTLAELANIDAATAEPLVRAALEKLAAGD